MTINIKSVEWFWKPKGTKTGTVIQNFSTIEFLDRILELSQNEINLIFVPQEVAIKMQ